MWLLSPVIDYFKVNMVLKELFFCFCCTVFSITATVSYHSSLTGISTAEEYLFYALSKASAEEPSLSHLCWTCWGTGQGETGPLLMRRSLFTLRVQIGLSSSRTLRWDGTMTHPALLPHCSRWRWYYWWLADTETIIKVIMTVITFTDYILTTHLFSTYYRWCSSIFGTTTLWSWRYGGARWKVTLPPTHEINALTVFTKINQTKSRIHKWNYERIPLFWRCNSQRRFCTC